MMVGAGEVWLNKQSPKNTKDVPEEGGGLADSDFRASPAYHRGASGEAAVVERVHLIGNDEADCTVKVPPCSILICMVET